MSLGMSSDLREHLFIDFVQDIHDHGISVFTLFPFQLAFFMASLRPKQKVKTVH